MMISAVKDKYEDFLIEFTSDRIPDKVQKKLVAFIRKKPHTTTSDIIEEYDRIRGVIPSDE